MGRSPQPSYDPLAFAVIEAHQRGLELHAWFNPFRARLSTAKSPISDNHVSRRRPQLVKQYGRSLWLDPGLREAQDYSLSVVLDVLKRYDIDGVHFDDYFYPYVEKDTAGNEIDFPDEATWRRLGAGRGLNRDDWRRDNVNNFVQRAYASIKSVKPWVKFGVSPFGIWRPGNPPGVRGYDPYEKIFADSRLWLQKGWLDYFSPQLYWSIDAQNHSFPALLKWWSQQNTKGRHLWPGLSVANIGVKWRAEEIANQIRLSRRESGVDGHVQYGITKLMATPALINFLNSDLYREPALIPASQWLAQSRPGIPKLVVSTKNRGALAAWTPAPGSTHFLWLLQARIAGRWETEILPRDARSKVWANTAPEKVAISAVDRTGQLSPPVTMEKPSR